MKQELGWADFQVRSDRAIRRHWALVGCAFAFCWWAEGHQRERGRADAAAAPAIGATPSPLPLDQGPGAGEKWGALAAEGLASRAHGLLVAAVLAPGAAARAGLA